MSGVAATKAAVLHVRLPNCEKISPIEEEKLEEAVGLARALDLIVSEKRIIHLSKISPQTLIGKGHVEDLHGIILHNEIGLVIVNSSLTPVQQRNLEKTWSCKVIDRTGLILEIFAKRARTAEGRLQVELAQLTYQRSRLVRSWTHLERQRGGFGFIGGPGESQLELDRRLIDERMAILRKKLDQVKKTRGLHRQARKRIPYPIISLVGYTNAGKSTLFNTLTKAQVFSSSQLFATLDPTMRLIKLPSGREVILSDTVGFISDLPTMLIAAFRATLEEVRSANILIHVQDCSHPYRDLHAKDVDEVLAGLDLQGQSAPIIAYNKVDLLTTEERDRLDNQVLRTQSIVCISAVTGENLSSLLNLIDQRLNEGRTVLKVTISPEQGKLLAWCYRRGAIVERRDEEICINLTLRLPPEDVLRFWELYHEGR